MGSPGPWGLREPSRRGLGGEPEALIEKSWGGWGRDYMLTPARDKLVPPLFQK